MPIVFPSSPVTGQVFTSGGRSWVWTGSVWDSPARDNPPLAIPQGNVIINGGFDIWQRGTNPTWISNNTTNLGPDRWYAISPAGRTHSRVASGLTGFQYAVRYQRTAGNTDTLAINAGQILETINSIPLAGQQVTLSFYARRGENYSGGNLLGAVNSGTGTDQNYVFPGFSGGAVVAAQGFPLTTNWQRFTVTGTVSSSATQLAVRIESGAFSGTAGANDWFEITGVQLEAGPVATPFKRNAPSIQAELAACQRYFEAGTTPAGRVGAISPSNSDFNTGRYVTFTVPKRTTPSVSVSVLNYDNAGTTNGSVGEIRPIGFYHSQPIALTGFAYNTIVINYTASSEL